MNIQSQISEELWNSINTSYNSENYSNAIKDAFLFLTELIRTKSGIESGDGEDLIGEVFGKKDPLIKINKYETVTERSEQDGFQFLLRGLYKFIRNPRNHETIFDTEDYANRIILFIDLIIQRINVTKDAFELGEYLNLIFDSDFEFNEKYMELLFQEIPEKYKFDVLIEIYRKNKQMKIANATLFCKYLLLRINSNMQDQFLQICSKDLLTTKDSGLIRSIIDILEPEMWKKVEKKAKIRIENILLDCIKVGSYNIHQRKTYGVTSKNYMSSLGTWAMNIIENFEDLEKINEIILSKINKLDGDIEEAYYLLEWFTNYLFTHKYDSLIFSKLFAKISDGDDFIKEKLLPYQNKMSFELNERFIKASEESEKINREYYNFDDEIPF